MRNLRLFAALALLPLSFAAHADKLAIPANAPPAFQSECGSCHLAFPPQLLAAQDWQRVMAGLDKHYGDNAALDEKTRRVIEDFLVRNGGAANKVSGGGTATSAELPRLTASPWFKRKHHEVARADWSHAKVKTASNCAACHTRAEAGSYRERELAMPDGRRWED